MNMRHIPFLVSIALTPITSQGATGMCTSADGGATVSITTNERGQVLVLDLTLTASGNRTRFPEANARSVLLPAFGFMFSTKQTTLHDALDLAISGPNGRMTFRGTSTALECDWTQN
jgi:hypothetical protein